MSIHIRKRPSTSRFLVVLTLSAPGPQPPGPWTLRAAVPANEFVLGDFPFFLFSSFKPDLLVTCAAADDPSLAFYLCCFIEESFYLFSCRGGVCPSGRQSLSSMIKVPTALTRSCCFLVVLPVRWFRIEHLNTANPFDG